MRLSKPSSGGTVQKPRTDRFVHKRELPTRSRGRGGHCDLFENGSLNGDYQESKPLPTGFRDTLGQNPGRTKLLRTGWPWDVTVPGLHRPVPERVLCVKASRASILAYAPREPSNGVLLSLSRFGLVADNACLKLLSRSVPARLLAADLFCAAAPPSIPS